MPVSTPVVKPVIVHCDAPPAVVTTSEQFCAVLQDTQQQAVIVTAGAQGPPGRDGLDGTAVDPDPDNQIEARPNGLYVKPSTWAEKEW